MTGRDNDHVAKGPGRVDGHHEDIKAFAPGFIQQQTKEENGGQGQVDNARFAKAGAGSVHTRYGDTPHRNFYPGKKAGNH